MLFPKSFMPVMMSLASTRAVSGAWKTASASTGIWFSASMAARRTEFERLSSSDRSIRKKTLSRPRQKSICISLITLTSSSVTVPTSFM